MRRIGLARAAGSLAFTTMLGLVPLATVALEFVARFPVFERWLQTFETFLLKHMLPDSANAVIETYVREFTEKAIGLTGLSLALIAVTATMVIATVEREINAIWGQARKRRLAHRGFVYALGITAGPVLIGASIWATTWVVTQSLAAVSVRKTMTEIALLPLPLLFSTAALALLYKVVPTTRVPWRHALVGALAAALAFEGAKQGFAFYVTHVPTYRVVYGALAALPLFLVWIYVCWLIVLTGAAISATLTLPVEVAPRYHYVRVLRR